MRSPFSRLAAAALAGSLALASPGAGWAEPRLPPAPEGAELPPGLTLSAGKDELALDWEAPAPRLETLASGETRLAVSGFAVLEEAGLPALPFGSVLVALPAGTAPVLEILSVVEETLHLAAPLERFAGRAGAELLAAPPLEEDQPGATDGPFPEQALVFERLGRAGGFELGRISFFPARLGQGEQELIAARRVQARLRFLPDSTTAARPAPQAGGALRDALAKAVINPAHLLAGGSPQAALANTLPPPPAAWVEISRPGLTALTYADLAAAGLSPQEWDPAQLRLEQGGAPVAFEWEGDADPVFGPGERLLFYAAPRFSRYAAYDALALYTGGEPGPRMVTRAAEPNDLPRLPVWVEALAEQNRIYTPNCYCGALPAGRDGERWTWEALQRPGRTEASFSVQLLPPNPALPARLTLWLIGFTNLPANPDHRVQAALNGQPLGLVEWDGKRAVEAVFELSPGLLQAGENTLHLSLPGLPEAAIEGAWLDAFQVEYAPADASPVPSLHFFGESSGGVYELHLGQPEGVRAYDLSDPFRPVRLLGTAVDAEGRVALSGKLAPGRAPYWVGGEAGLLAPLRVRPAFKAEPVPAAEYLALGPAAFLPALEGLLELRREQGLSAAAAPLEWIYEAYGEGRPDPLAIHRFLKAAYENGQPPLRYVLLVGDATYDPRGYLPSSGPTFLPPFLAQVDPWAGETAADNRYAALNGDDFLPDVLIGRLPVRSPEETQALAEKIVRYERQPEAGAWAGRAVFAADNPDAAGNFPALAERLAWGPAAPPMPVQRLYHRAGADPLALREQVLDTWQQGSLVMLYLGHASLHQWAAENFLHLQDLPALQNGGRLPVLLSLTCFTGSFHAAGLDALDEALLRHPQGGVVAAWASTGSGVSSGHLELAQGFLGALFGTPGGSLGEAALAGKLALVSARPALRDLIDTYTLLGDPATLLDRSYQGGVFNAYLPFMQNSSSFR